MTEGMAAIQREIAEETRTSPFKDRISRDRIHPIQRDLGMVISFIICRRRRSGPAIFDLARRAIRHPDPEAVCLLVYSVLHDGACSPAMHRCCARLLFYTEKLVTALLLRDELRPEVH